MGVGLRLRLHRFKCIPFLHHMSLEAKSQDGREKVVMEHFPKMDPSNTDPRVLSLIGVKSLSDPNPEFEVVFEAHPDHSIESLASFSRSRPWKYVLFLNDCRTHSFAVIKHAMMPPPEDDTIKQKSPSLRVKDGFELWRFGW